MMRMYARYTDQSGNKLWDVVTTDPNTGDNSMVYLVNLIQVLLLNLGESPFYANYGIPGKQAVASQVAPDFYVAQTQRQFAPFFASLIVSKASNNPPTYNIRAVTKYGVKIDVGVPIQELSQYPGAI